MNNFTATTLIGWETRNWRKHQKALDLCKNHGLKPILRNLFIGNLYSKERRELLRTLNSLFVRTTDRLSFITLCKSCLDVATLDATIKQRVSDFPAFEIIQVQTGLPRQLKR